MKFPRLVGLIVLWLAAVLTLAGADVGPRRALLSSQVPGWVQSSYGKFGATPSTALQFANGRAWQQGLGSGSPQSFLTVSRASTAYEDDNSGTWYPFTSGQLRVTNKGALIEESRTNSIRNDSMQGAVAGTPGTRPNFWQALTLSGLTQTIVGTGTQNGIDYIDIQISGTSAGTAIGIAMDNNTTIAATTGQTWTQSVFLALVGGDFTNVTSFVQRVSERTNTGTLVQNDDGSNIVSSVNATLTRFTWTPTLSGGATTAFATPNLTFVVNNTSAINFTIRIGWPQLELGAFATSPIRTTSAAATRAADVVTVTTFPVLGKAYSLYVNAIPTAPTSYANQQGIVTIDDGSTNNRVGLRRISGTGNAGILIVFSGSATTGTSVAVIAQSASFKLAGAFAAGDQALSLNGAAVVTAAAASLPAAPTQIDVGAGAQTATQPFDGYITELAIWASTRISNAGLIAGTTP